MATATQQTSFKRSFFIALLVYAIGFLFGLHNYHGWHMLFEFFFFMVGWFTIFCILERNI